MTDQTPEGQGGKEGPWVEVGAAADNYRAGWTHTVGKDLIPPRPSRHSRIPAGRAPTPCDPERAEKGWGQVAESRPREG